MTHRYLYGSYLRNYNFCSEKLLVINSNKKNCYLKKKKEKKKPDNMRISFIPKPCKHLIKNRSEKQMKFMHKMATEVKEFIAPIWTKIRIFRLNSVDWKPQTWSYIPDTRIEILKAYKYFEYVRCRIYCFPSYWLENFNLQYTVNKHLK